MKIVVAAEDDQWEELTKSCTPQDWIRVAGNSEFTQYADAAIFFDLRENAAMNIAPVSKPVFINSVITTLQEAAVPANIFRMNGWRTFLSRPVWEIAGKVDAATIRLLAQLGKKVVAVADEPGFIAARVIAMIINEGYYALGDEVSTKAEIDTAMRSGTNYPYGPFEWAQKIGIKNIHLLLQKLAGSDNRYRVAPSLTDEAFQLS